MIEVQKGERKAHERGWHTYLVRGKIWILVTSYIKLGISAITQWSGP